MLVDIHRLRRAPAILFTALLAAGFLALTFAGSARAEGQLALTVSPLKLEMSAEAGERLEREVWVKNSASALLNITAETQDFVAGKEAGKPVFVPAGEVASSMVGWIRMKPASFVLKPGEEKMVRLTIDVPKKAEPGGHYAAALFGTNSAGPGQTKVVAKVGSLLLLTVSGQVREAASVSLLSAQLLEPGPVDFQLQLENSGNVHVKPEGVVKVDPVLWGEKAELRVGGENVLPGSTRETTLRLDDLPFGIYRASASLTYGEGKLLATSEPRTFFVLPWKMSLAALSIFALGVLTSLGVARLAFRRRKVEAAEDY